MREEEKPDLRRLPLFREMSETTFNTLMQVSYAQNFPPALDLFSQGDPADFLHVIVEGRVELHSEWNDRTTVMGVVEPVTAFILAACVRGSQYLMSARTITRARIVLIPTGDVRLAMSEDIDFAMAAMDEMARDYRVMVRHAKNLKLRTARERLAAWMLSESALHGDALGFTLSVEKRRLASYLGITAESLSRSLRSLREDGLRVDGARVTITDRARLAPLAKPDVLIDGPEQGGTHPPV